MLYNSSSFSQAYALDAANVWTYMSCDEEAGLVYLPFGTPVNDFRGGNRPGS